MASVRLRNQVQTSLSPPKRGHGIKIKSEDYQKKESIYGSSKRIDRGVLLPIVVGLPLNVRSILLQQDITVLSTRTVRRGDMVLHGFQPYDDLLRGLIVRLLALSVKVGQYLVQPEHAGLCIIKKFKHAPANWWRCVVVPSVYSSRFKVCHSFTSSITQRDDFGLSTGAVTDPSGHSSPNISAFSVQVLSRWCCWRFN